MDQLLYLLKKYLAKRIFLLLLKIICYLEIRLSVTVVRFPDHMSRKLNNFKNGEKIPRCHWAWIYLHEFIILTVMCFDYFL